MESPERKGAGEWLRWDRSVDVEGVALRVHGIVAPGGAANLRAPALVFLHDSLGCVETWRDFPAELARRTGLDAIVYDRRGYGGSAPFSKEPRTPRYLAQEAATLLRLLDALDVGSAVLFGHSDGGTIALYAGALATDRIQAIVSEAAHVVVEELSLDGIRAAREALRTTDLRDRLVRYHGDKVDGVTSAWIDTWLDPGFRDWNMLGELPQVVAPVLAVQGEGDEYGTPAQVRAIVERVSGPVRALMIPIVGHTPHRDARDVVLDASVEWIGEHVRPTP